MRWTFYIFFFFVLIFVSCGIEKKTDNGSTSLFVSKNATDFDIRFAKDTLMENLLRDSVIFGSGASVSIEQIGGLDALEIKTDQEFSDAFLNLEQLFNHTIDFNKSRYISMKLWVPKESWITALKFNIKDAKGNFGGFNEITNNFHQNHDKWMNVIVDMQEIIPVFKNWVGEGNPLSTAKFLSFNPYNAHQADSSSIYVHSIKLTEQFPKDIVFQKTLAPRPKVEQNVPHTITFDKEDLFREQIAIRAFESTYQALEKNVAGNETRAIRMKGKENNKHLAFLPILDKLTGTPVDFTKVKHLKFSYYLTEDSPDFDGAILYLADENWNNVLINEKVYSDFKKGSWQDVTIDFASLNFDQMENHDEVLSNVHEIRFGLNYRPGQKDVEIWLDNFGWE